MNNGKERFKLRWKTVYWRTIYNGRNSKTLATIFVRFFLFRESSLIRALASEFSWPQGRFYGHASMDRITEEIVQLLSEKLLRYPIGLAKAHCKGPGSMEAYLRKTVESIANEIARKAFRRMKICKIVGETIAVSQEDGEQKVSIFDTITTGACPQHEHLVNRERIEMLHELCDRYISEDPRRELDVEAYILRNFCEWSFLDIAEHQGCQRQTASKRHRKSQDYVRDHRDLFY